MLKRILVPALLAGTIMGAGFARAEGFSQMVAFSGALSDTGNFNAELGQDRPAPFYKNRSTNGPVAVEELARWLGQSAEPSMHLTFGYGGHEFRRGRCAGGRAWPP